MSSAPGSFEGWTLAEALARTKTAGESVESARSALWNILLGNRLVATGSNGRANEVSNIVSSESWIDLVATDWENSTIQERGTGAEIYNVRVFPVLHSQHAPAHLAGRSLADVFRSFVIEDPEIAALGKEVSRQDGRHAAVFRDGQYPGYIIDFKWPLDLSTDDLAYGFVKPFIWFVGNPMPKASEAVKKVAHVIIDRLQALRSILADGKLIARGTFATTGMIGTLDALQWRRSGLWVDVRNGDLFEDENNNLVLRWSGLALVERRIPGLQTVAGMGIEQASYLHGDGATAREAKFHVKRTALDRIRPSTTPQEGASSNKGERALARVETTVTSYNECVAWLVQIMRKSPDERAETKESLWNKAQAKWPGTLSQRSFLSARAEAIRSSGAKVWGAAGASKKSMRKSAR
jgi:hypothetical protein